MSRIPGFASGDESLHASLHFIACFESLRLFRGYWAMSINRSSDEAEELVDVKGLKCRNYAPRAQIWLTML